MAASTGYVASPLGAAAPEISLARWGPPVGLALPRAARSLDNGRWVGVEGHLKGPRWELIEGSVHSCLIL